MPCKQQHTAQDNKSSLFIQTFVGLIQAFGAPNMQEVQMPLCLFIWHTSVNPNPNLRDSRTVIGSIC